MAGVATDLMHLEMRKKMAYFELGCVARKSSVCYFLVGRHCERVKSTKTKWQSYHSSIDFHILGFPTWHVGIRFLLQVKELSYGVAW